MVRDLRERTGAGLMECKRALEASQGDFEGAVDHLRKQGLKTADKKAERETGEGRLQAWIGPKMRVGSLVALHRRAGHRRCRSPTPLRALPLRADGLRGPSSNRVVACRAELRCR
jgi:hypothetical protein